MELLWSNTLLRSAALAPAYHGNNLDEFACLTIPLVLLGIVFLVVRRRESDADDEETPEPEEPKAPVKKTRRKQ
jgi:hypothetical protein